LGEVQDEGGWWRGHCSLVAPLCAAHRRRPCQLAIQRQPGGPICAAFIDRLKGSGRLCRARRPPGAFPILSVVCSGCRVHSVTWNTPALPRSCRRSIRQVFYPFHFTRRQLPSVDDSAASRLASAAVTRLLVYRRSFATASVRASVVGMGLVFVHARSLSVCGRRRKLNISRLARLTVGLFTVCTGTRSTTHVQRVLSVRVPLLPASLRADVVRLISLLA
jgi:hypothetical protein